MKTESFLFRHKKKLTFLLLLFAAAVGVTTYLTRRPVCPPPAARPKVDTARYWSAEAIRLGFTDMSNMLMSQGWTRVNGNLMAPAATVGPESICDRLLANDHDTVMGCLPDGTGFRMYPDTNLNYSSQITSEERLVSLDGNVEFSINGDIRLLDAKYQSCRRAVPNSKFVLQIQCCLGTAVFRSDVADIRVTDRDSTHPTKLSVLTGHGTISNGSREWSLHSGQTVLFTPTGDIDQIIDERYLAPLAVNNLKN